MAKSKLSIGAKLVSGFLATAAISLVVGVVALLSTNGLIRQMDKTQTIVVQPLSIVIDMLDSFQSLRVDVRNAILETDQDKMAAVNEAYKADMASFNKSLDTFEPTIILDDTKKTFAQLRNLVSTFQISADQELVLAFANKNVEAKDFMNQNLVPVANQISDLIDVLRDSKLGIAASTYQESAATSVAVQIGLIATIVIGFAFGILLGIILSRQISKPMNAIASQLTGSAAQIGTAAGQVSESSQQIANGAAEQASSIEETTSSMEELASMVRQNVANAREATVLAEKTRDISQEGGVHMEKMLSSINEINTSSEEIVNIIDVIDDIAFQTNMLALNAAVEAARAGEAGLGFAVVADEVKNLANRSAESAKETAKIIKTSIKKSGEGVEVAQKLSAVFKEILENVRRVAEMSKEVESASSQQDRGINEVNKAIVEFDTVVQQNAATSEETAGASEEMLGQVNALNLLVKDLLQLVTGKAERAAEVKTHAETRPKALPDSRQPKHLLAYNHPHTSANHHPSQGDAAPAKKETKPQDVLSFEDDEEFAIR